MKWTISRSRARLGGWHVQARTEDQFSSFTVIAGEGSNYYRGKSPNGNGDVFTLTDPITMATMNIVGEIRYVQEWGDVS